MHSRPAATSPGHKPAAVGEFLVSRSPRSPQSATDKRQGDFVDGGSPLHISPTTRGAFEKLLFHSKAVPAADAPPLAFSIEDSRCFGTKSVGGPEWSADAVNQAISPWGQHRRSSLSKQLNSHSGSRR